MPQRFFPCIAMLTYADFRNESSREEELQKLLQQLRAVSAQKESQPDEVGGATTIVIDEGHGQRRWRHIPPTSDLGYSVACQVLANYGSIIPNHDPFSLSATLHKCNVLILPMPFGTLVEDAEYESLAHWVYSGGNLLMCGFYFMEAHHYSNFQKLSSRLQIQFGHDLIMPKGRSTRDDALAQAFPVRRDLCVFTRACPTKPDHPIIAGVERVAVQSSCTAQSLAQNTVEELEVQTTNDVSIMSPKRGEMSDILPGKFDIVYEHDVREAEPATFLVARPCGKGRVVATGSWRIFINDYMEDDSVDNSKLFQNTIRWLLSA